jgi:Fic family protein
MLLPFHADLFAGSIAELDRLATRLDARVLSRRWEGRLRRSLEAEAIAASTSMEGVPVTVDDALKILAGDTPEDVSPRDQALVRGYRDAMTFVQRRADDGALIWNRELVVGVQDRIVAGDVSAGAGKLRERATWITNSRTGDVIFEPPPPEDVPGLVDEVGQTIESAGWHPALEAAWTHVALAATHPFLDGNGRTARVMASLAMYRGGFRHPAFTSLEEWWGSHPSTYYEAFDCLGDRFDRERDVTDFVLAHVKAQLTQVVALDLRQHTDGLLWTTLENLLEDRGLSPRLANALYDGFYGREITTSYYASIIDASPATARNDLTAAAAAGLLIGEGRTRGRRYRATPALTSTIAKALGTEDGHMAIVKELLARSQSALDHPTPGSSEARQEPLPGVG